MTQLPDTVPTPEYLQIEPVGQCNMRCRMCAIQYRHDGPPYGPPAFMDFDLYTRLVDGFTNLKTLHLQGLGEPMMHPRFFDMARYATGKGIKVTINTNLSLLNPQRAEQCITSGLQSVMVSVDGSTAEIYEYIRIRGHFDRLLRNIDLLVDTRARLQSQTPDLRVVMVVMRQNLSDLPNIVRLAADHGIHDVFVQHLSHDFSEPELLEQYRAMHDFVESETLLNVKPDEIARHFTAARLTASELGVTLRLPATSPRLHAPGTPGPERCDWPWNGAYISYDGYAMPCCMVSTPDRVNMGNFATAGVEEVWNGPAYQDFRRQLSSDTPPSVCASCSLYKGVF